MVVRRFHHARDDPQPAAVPGGCEVKSTLAFQTTRVGAAMLFPPLGPVAQETMTLLEPLSRWKWSTKLMTSVARSAGTCNKGKLKRRSPALRSVTRSRRQVPSSYDLLPSIARLAGTCNKGNPERRSSNTTRGSTRQSIAVDFEGVSEQRA